MSTRSEIPPASPDSTESTTGAFAIVGVFEIVFGLARRRLPRNRFVRAVFFTLTAASVVIALTVASAMGRVALFGASSWLPALLIASGVGFVLGYLSPGRVERGARDSTDDSVIDLVAAEAVARASGGVRGAGLPREVEATA